MEAQIMHQTEPPRIVPSNAEALPCDFYLRSTEVVARDLIGKLLVKRTGGNVLAGVIVETEAYLPENDPACHAFRGKTERTAPMFEAGGIAYVYLIYGIHYCVNAVTEAQGRGAAVLIRALEPLAGVEIMERRRRQSTWSNLCNGPGKLASAFGFTKRDNYASFQTSELCICPWQPVPARNIGISTRIGIRKARQLPLRFYLTGNPCVSKGKPS